MNLGPCPHCKKGGGVYQAVRLDGRAKLLWDGDGQPIGIQPISELFTPHSDAVRCAYCHHIRRGWQVWDGELVRQGE